MKTLITATAITLATAATAMAGSYAGVEYNSTDASIAGIPGSATLSGPRVYLGGSNEFGDTTIYTEVGFSSRTIEAGGYSSDSSEDADWKVGVDHKLSDSTTVYINYESNMLWDVTVGQTNVGIRWEF